MHAGRALAAHDGWHDAPWLLSRDIVHYNPIRRDLALLATWGTDSPRRRPDWSADLRATGRVKDEAWIGEQMYHYRETSHLVGAVGRQEPGPAAGV